MPPSATCASCRSYPTASAASSGTRLSATPRSSRSSRPGRREQIALHARARSPAAPQPVREPVCPPRKRALGHPSEDIWSCSAAAGGTAGCRTGREQPPATSNRRSTTRLRSQGRNHVRSGASEQSRNRHVTDAPRRQRVYRKAMRLGRHPAIRSLRQHRAKSSHILHGVIAGPAKAYCRRLGAAHAIRGGLGSTDLLGCRRPAFVEMLRAGRSRVALALRLPAGRRSD